jgi:hypothetical protein
MSQTWKNPKRVFETKRNNGQQIWHVCSERIWNFQAKKIRSGGKKRANENNKLKKFDVEEITQFRKRI